jgi:hypothetical protein
LDSHCFLFEVTALNTIDGDGSSTHLPSIEHRHGPAKRIDAQNMTQAEIAALRLAPPGLWPQPPARVTQPPAGRWAGPHNYDDDWDRFMRGEVALSYNESRGVKLYRPDHSKNPFVSPTSSHVVRFGDEPTDISLAGLWGCTAVVVISKRGALVIHIWEEPSMRGFRDPKKIGNTNSMIWEYEPQEWIESRFKNDVLKALHHGGPWDAPHKAGIEDLRRKEPPDDTLARYKELLADEAEPRAFIMIPVPESPSARGQQDVQYQEKFERMKSEIISIFEGYRLPSIRTYVYTPLAMKEVESAGGLTADPGYSFSRGKLLVQYQPQSKESGVMVSSYRVWFEGKLFPWSQVEWT